MIHLYQTLVRSQRKTIKSVFPTLIGGLKKRTREEF